MQYFLGLDVGGTKCAVSLGELVKKEQETYDMQVVAKEKFATANKTPLQVLEQFYQVSKEMLEKRNMVFSDIISVGISCGGPLDSKNGVILSPPNLPGWDRIEIVRFFEERMGVPVFLQNDANACAVAEWKFGAGRGSENMVFLTFGTGLGAGMILNGNLYCGASDMAGEIGHVRLEKENGGFLPTGYGKRGSAEGYCSGGGLAQIGRNAMGASKELYEAAEGDPEKVTAQLMAELARKGEPVCQKIYHDCGRKLGETLAILMDIVNPDKIVLGGVYMRAEDLLRPGMERVLEEEALLYARNVCNICPAGLGEYVGDYAALSVAVAGSGRL